MVWFWRVPSGFDAAYSIFVSMPYVSTIGDSKDLPSSLNFYETTFAASFAVTRQKFGGNGITEKPRIS